MCVLMIDASEIILTTGKKIFEDYPSVTLTLRTWERSAGALNFS